MRLLLLICLIVFSDNAVSCCASPLASNVLIAKIESSRKETKRGKDYYYLTMSKISDVYGNSPEVLNGEVYGSDSSDIVVGGEYLVTLFESSKYDKQYYLLKEPLQKKELAIHPVLGVQKTGSLKAEKIMDLLKENKSIAWTTTDVKFLVENF